MKNRSKLATHPNPGLQKLFIKNALTKSEIKTNIALNEMLKKIPGQENSFVAGSGHIMSKNDFNKPPRGRAPPRQNHYNQGQQQPHPHVPYPNQPYFPQQFGYMPNMGQPQGAPLPHMTPMPMFGAPYNPFMQYQPTPGSVPVSTAAAQPATGQSQTVGVDRPQVPGQDTSQQVHDRQQEVMEEAGSQEQSEEVIVQADVHQTPTP